MPGNAAAGVQHASAMGQRTLPLPRVPGWWRWLSVKFYAAGGRVKLYKALARVLRQRDVNLTAVLRDLYLRAYHRSKIDSTTVVLGDVYASLTRGEDIDRAFASFAKPIELMLIRGGQAAGEGRGHNSDERRTGLQRAMQQILHLYDAQRETRKALFSAYSTLVLYATMIIISLLVVSDYVVPKIAVAFPTSHWTGIAYSMYAVSKIVDSTGFATLVGALIVILIAIPVSFPYWRGRLRDILDRHPPYSFYRLQEGGGWIVSIPALIENGRMNVLQAAKQTAALGKPWLRSHILRIVEGLNRGMNFGDAMIGAGGFPDREVAEDVSLYESQHIDIDVILKEVSADWSESGSDLIKLQARVMETAVRIVFALVLLWYVLGTVVLQIQMPAYFMSASGV